MIKIVAAAILCVALIASVYAQEETDISKIKEMLHKARAEESAKWAAANLIETIKLPGDYLLNKYTVTKIGTDSDESNLYSLSLEISIVAEEKTINKLCTVEISDNPITNARLFKSDAQCVDQQ